jgi:hypothetical protein
MTMLEELYRIQPRAELFHYTSFAGFLGIVSSRTLWASSIHYLNDAKEFALGCSIALDELSSRISERTSREDDAFFLSLEERIQQVRYINVFVASFSQVPDQLSQWRGYCPPSKGMCLGFSSRLLATRAAAQGFKLVPAMYDRKRQEELVRELVDDTIRRYRLEPTAAFDLTKTFGYDLAIVSPLLKDVSFAQEEEWRLVSTVTFMPHPQVRVREGHARIVPYFAFELTDSSDALELTSVTAGPTPEDVLVLRSIWFANKVHGVVAPEPVLSRVPFRPW